MNELQKSNDYLISKFQSDSLVNTITTLPNDRIDTNKETIYPVVNIEYKTSNIREDSLLFSYNIKVLDQNDIYIKSTDSKLHQDTNQLDILNETYNICQSFINSFRTYNDSNVELLSVSDILVIKNENLNDLSGHEFSLIVSVQNEGSSCP